MKETVSIRLLTCLMMGLLLTANPAIGAAFQSQYKFQYLTANEGLPQNTVDCILKDKRGFMWFGTWNGLCRYDGYSFKTYKRDTHPDGLHDNFIHALCEDPDGNIWIGTGKGLAHFNFSTDRFDLPGNLEQIFGSMTINHLAYDLHGSLWVGTENYGMWLISRDGGQLVPQKLDDSLFPGRHINCMALAGGNAFVGTESGLAVMDAGQLALNPSFGELVYSLQNINIFCIFIDSKNTIWVGTDVGLYQYEPDITAVYYYSGQVNYPGALDHLTVTAITEDPLGNVIVGTLGGLNYFNPADRTFFQVKGSFFDQENLNNPFVNSLLADEQGNVWIGTDKGGVNQYNIHQKPFASLRHDRANPNSLSHNTINSIYNEGDVLWVGTAGGGLNRITGMGKQVERFYFDANNPASIGSDFVTSIYRDGRKNLWLGTWGAGLFRLVSQKEKTFENFHFDPDSANSLCSEFVSSVIGMGDGQLLVGTLGGLDLFNIDQKSFVHLHERMKVPDPFEVGCLLLDRESHLWIGTRHGLYRLDAAQLKTRDDLVEVASRSYFNNADDTLSLAGNYVISLHEDRQGNVWIGTYGNGFCRYEQNEVGKEIFIRYTEKEGLCNNVVYAIEEDLQGNLWLSTDRGLSKFNPLTEEFQNFFVKDGLLSDQFYWTASDADAEGNLYFGSISGLNYFNASEIDRYEKNVKPVFTEFSVFNNPVNIGQKYHSKVILPLSVTMTERLELSYKDAVFSIEFSALDYFLPEKVRYQYKMEGVDQNWVEVPASRRFANYTNLSGGEYTFRVKASNSDGVWSDEEATLKIVVHPPFWQTAWFRVIFVLAITLLVMAYIRMRVRFLKEQKRKLEKQVKERTEKIEEQKEKLEQQAFRLQKTNQQLEERQRLIEGQKVELELQNTKIAQQRDELIELNEKVNLVNQLRLRFFTNISHEFRTPLTLIIDPLEQLMRNLKEDKNTVNTLKIINRNAQRLLHLINQLIYFRRLETGKMNLRVAKGDLKQFLFQVFESFADLAQHQKIDYRFLAADPPAETWFDAEKLENIFYNLLSNAFKYTPEQGMVSMTVFYAAEGTFAELPAPHVCVEVKDSGPGIEAEHLPFIFERFYQARSEKNTSLKSSGIGLALTLELVQALHGHIQVLSEPGKGSRFLVRLPYLPGQFDEKELDQTVVPAEVNLQGRVDVLLENMVFVNETEQEEADEQKRSKPLVLIVEDNFDLRSFLTQTLKTDYRILGAENGKDGLQMARKYSPDLIISDVMMPLMDGLELCSHLKKDIQTSHIPVILLTAQAMVENWIEGLESGADDYVPKPFNLQVLQARMVNLIESRRRLKKMFSSPQDNAVSDLTTNSVDEEFLSRAYSILEKFHQNPDFSASQFASEMFVSRSLLFKKIKAITDLNITDFINSFKLKKAVVLIRESKQPISDIAFQVGFNDPKYFSRIFKKFYGMSPSEFSSSN
ncbi:two-component regulator propeller domain-containing protein [Gaoshiqia sediminis]|uniref:histidine kinase n=1 Tax=Gaoshiqia sediminis TaxID=2986998 RepID=A0AA41YBA8_9BACT|nr:two-component regulator propeller domain-containing protein [Gaoshiqia sediminis]MCW0483008.1 response regulator [Gaoshiqia sediminis]